MLLWAAFWSHLHTCMCSERSIIFQKGWFLFISRQLPHSLLIWLITVFAMCQVWIRNRAQAALGLKGLWQGGLEKAAGTIKPRVKQRQGSDRFSSCMQQLSEIRNWFPGTGARDCICIQEHLFPPQLQQRGAVPARVWTPLGCERDSGWAWISSPRMLGVRMGLAVVRSLWDMPGWRETPVSSATWMPKTNIRMACGWAAQGGIPKKGDQAIQLSPGMM